MSVYRKFMDFISNHIFVYGLSIIMIVLVVAACVDKQSFLVDRAAVVFLLWLIALIRALFVEIKAKRNLKKARHDTEEKTE